MAGIAPPFQVPKVHISSHFSPPRRAPGAETCINRAATGKFTLSQLLPTIGRRAGNIPASDPDTHPDLPRTVLGLEHFRATADGGVLALSFVTALLARPPDVAVKGVEKGAEQGEGPQPTP